ncbi:MAG: tRNA(Met) cytidine acetyltransferase [Oceanicoccus sp.]|jgi:tRNA(Met) cytidine acetyltransferase
MQTWLSQLSASSKARQHRQVIWLAGDHHWAWQLINPWLSQFKRNIYVGQAELKHAYLTCTKASKPNTLLGYESDNVVFDAHHGLFPDALSAIAGTLLPGGFLFLLTPPLKDYPLFSDEFAKGRTSLGFEDQCNNQHTIKRLLGCAANHQVLILEQAHPQHLDNLLTTFGANESNTLGKAESINLKGINTLIKTNNGQLDVFKRVLNLFNELNIPNPIPAEADNSQTPPAQQLHVITADRGRGKSHLLGMLADYFINSSKDNGINYFICAPNKASTSSVYKHLNEPTKQLLQFVAPERLMDSAKPNDIILIDEAASLPIGQLIKWSQHFTRIIMATTTHGYEGTGKGFQIRFFDHLNQQAANGHFSWQQHTLTEPVRYASNDPLERWLFDAFCLDSEPSALAFSQSEIKQALNTLEITYLTKAALSESPNLLKQVFALLVQAHYQTKPSDLRDLLDAPGLHLFAQLISINNTQHVIGVCLFSDEGPIAHSASSHEDLHQDILNGYRRPKGHLMPQVMAHHMGATSALNLKGARIVRIATLENIQRCGLGSQLLKTVSDHCKENQYDYVGSSFADTQDVRHFWFKNEFKLIRQGNKQDKASGTQSALVMYGLSTEGIKLEAENVHFFERQSLPIDSSGDLKPTDAILLHAFLEHSGSYESAKVILKRIKGFDLTLPRKASKELKLEIKDWLGV